MTNDMTQTEQVALLATPPDARDVAAELAAPPRRPLPWLSLLLAGGVIATGAFAGGVWYQKGNGSSAPTPRAAAPASGGFGQNGSRRGGQGQGGQPGFTRGTVKAVDGTTVYLTDANGNTVKVTTGDATKVQLTKDGKVADLQPGQSVTVVGTPDAGGGYMASQLVEGGAVGNRTPSGG
ncbi:hypothetical protein [Kitasatospora sp. NPDC093558]|uniref:hypothetical protein n=1 Tax=Kitasatospora sp. NPDC093558 TaxID=3155201 RepID=UPI0034312192